MGVNGALKLAAQQAAKKKKSYEGLPGVKVSNEDVKIETISIKSGKDNADDILHHQRFRLSGSEVQLFLQRESETD